MKVYKKILSLAIFIALLTTGFMLNSTFSKKVLAAENSVQLYYTQYVNNGYYGGSASGYICVNNLAYDKKVTVRYYSGIRQWKEVPATYYKTNLDGTEIWSFSLAFSDNHYTSLAIKYEVNGQTYWDNNNGKNYEVDYQAIKFDFGKSKVCVMNYSGNVDANTNEKYGDIAVCAERIKESKNIKVRYTEDNWATYKEVTTSKYTSGIESSTTNRVQYEHTRIPFSQNTEQVKFAVCYEANGVEYWDNNFGEDYCINFKK